MRTPLALLYLSATALVAQSSQVIDEPILAGVLDSATAAQFVLPVHGFSATQLAFLPVPHPALRVGASTVYAPDPLLCSANYVGADVEHVVFALPQGGIVLLDASSSLTLHVLAVPPGTWSLPTGICIDRAHDQIVVLDAAEPRFLRIALADLRAGNADFQSTSLPQAWSAVRGIALDVARDRIIGLDPVTGNLLQHTANSPKTDAGMLRRLPAVRSFGFAPTLNLSQPSVELDLFVTSGDARMLTDQWTWNTTGIDDETGTLRATVLTSTWVPPSPDPSGLAYDPVSDRLVIFDSEVEEMTIYANVNVYESSRTGTLLRTSKTVSYTPEPAGATYDTATRTYYIADDDRDKIYVTGVGPDGLLHTADDILRSFKVGNFCADAEGLAYDSASNTLWIAAGVANCVHRLRPGPNGLFDGTSPNGDDLLATFDVAGFGVTDPSGVALRAGDGGIHVLGIPKTRLLHLNKVGQLVRVINLPNTSMVRPQGLVFAPSTVSTGDSLFLVDRGHDNDVDPLENDGKFREYGMPTPASINMQPVVNAGPDLTILTTASAHLAGIAEDDGLGGPLTRQWTKLSGPGTVTFTAATSAVTNATFSAAGNYTLQLSASDTVFTSTDTVVVTVQAPLPGIIIERTVAATWDDAEEQPTTVVRSSTDLEMTTDGTIPQVVGIRFLNLTIPPGATVASATVQFTTDEAKSVATALTISGEASDNAATYQTTASSISTRPRTTATVSWAPAAWNVVGEAGANQRTPELATVVQQIVSRPGWVSGNALAFVITGTGCRSATAFDGSPALAPKLVVRYLSSAVNVAPVVNAGPDVSTLLTSPAHLVGTATDDGLVQPMAITWSKVSGPGTATFTAPNQAVTDVTFSLAGSYVCRISAYDGQYTSTDTCSVTVTQGNQPPVVNAGPDLTVAIPSAAHLAGAVTDDGQITPVTIQWSKVSGPGTTTFTTPAAAVTDVTFSLSGSYTLRLQANDGQFTVSDTCVVTVTAPNITLNLTIPGGNDDAEQRGSTMDRTGNALEMCMDGTTNGLVGLRFTGVTIPPGAVITAAYVQFTTSVINSSATSLTVAGEAADNSAAFSNNTNNISLRALTAATVPWAPVAWTVANEAGVNQRTPSLTSIAQQIVNRPAWVSGNAMTFIISGTAGTRSAQSRNASTANAPKLVITYHQ